MSATSKVYSRKMELYLKKKKNSTSLISHDHHLMNSSNVIALDKLTSNKIYSALISKIYLYVI